ncbi:MAG: hypothetical protein AAGE94_09915 [Acidobacteriota bacterium]
MLKIGRALLWEQWRLSRRPLASLGAGVFGISWLLLTFSSPETPAESRSLMWALVMMQILLTVLLLLQARDPSARRAGFGELFYRLPVTTPALVHWRRLGLILGASLLGLVVLVFASLGHGLQWPVWPALLANAVAVTSGAAMVWTLASSLTSAVVVAGILIVGFGWWLAALVGVDLGIGFGEAAGSLAAQGLGILATVVAWRLALWGVARDRRGEPIDPESIGRRMVDGWGRRRAAVPPELSSPVAAQYWMEWRQKGHFMPLHTAAVLVVVVVANIWGGIDTAGMLRLLGVFFPFVCLALPPMVGVLVGRFSASTELPALDPFRATRPLGDRTMALVFLGFGGANLLASYLTLIVGSLAILGFLWLFGDRTSIEALWASLTLPIEVVGWPTVGLLIGMAVLIAWVAMGLAASIALTGRASVGAVLILVPYAVLAAFIVLHKSGRLDQLLSYGNATAWVLGVAAMLATAAAFVAGRRSRLLPTRWPWIALACWVGLVALGLVAFERGVVEHVLEIMRESGAADLLASSGLEHGLIVLGLGLLALVTAPPAFAPLALSWNRHR